MRTLQIIFTALLLLLIAVGHSYAQEEEFEAIMKDPALSQDEKYEAWLNILVKHEPAMASMASSPQMKIVLRQQFDSMAMLYLQGSAMEAMERAKEKSQAEAREKERANTTQKRSPFQQIAEAQQPLVTQHPEVRPNVSDDDLFVLTGREKSIRDKKVTVYTHLTAIENADNKAASYCDRLSIRGVNDWQLAYRRDFNVKELQNSYGFTTDTPDVPFTTLYSKSQTVLTRTALVPHDSIGNEYKLGTSNREREPNVDRNEGAMLMPICITLSEVPREVQETVFTLSPIDEFHFNNLSLGLELPINDKNMVDRHFFNAAGVKDSDAKPTRTTGMKYFTRGDIRRALQMAKLEDSKLAQVILQEQIDKRFREVRVDADYSARLIVGPDNRVIYFNYERSIPNETLTQETLANIIINQKGEPLSSTAREKRRNDLMYGMLQLFYSPSAEAFGENASFDRFMRLDERDVSGPIKHVRMKNDNTFIAQAYDWEAISTLRREIIMYARNELFDETKAREQASMNKVSF
ncbi:hypothetical protein KJ365_11380 [Glaciecola sp. XM2]|jgi:hypothetical protein|uniref:hypothetical protein n=1 Tax=Glaciecola sp. XM2 TaxID=1914931 RepID=UPI001BDE06B9|nr:hypothetical protein [Glaciecola sp. XM2]MBT1451481.1 hypothetical protein [Glaciecola sp. XM2]